METKGHGGKIMMPQELKDQLMSEYQMEVQGVLGAKLEVAYDMGFQAGQATGGTTNPDLVYSQAQLDEAVAIAKTMVKDQAVAAVQNHDANTQVDADLVALIQAIH